MDFLADVSHRQWPVPSRPWVLKQAWNDLLFAHWPVARDRLREIVPSFLEIDTFDNEAWVTVAPFKLSDLSPRGVPALPWISAFDEINVRTYVLYDGIPGVYFFSLDANSVSAVVGASTLYHLPYFLADIQMRADRGKVFYRSSRSSGAAVFEAEYAPAGPLFQAERGTLAFFLTERYCLYTQDAAGNAYRVDIHHRPWQLHDAEAHITVNTMAVAARLQVPAVTPVLHFARRQEVLTWMPRLLR